MLGLDLRRVTVGDDLYKIIANRELIALNQDALGVQAKRVATTFDCGGKAPDKAYIENINRIDVLAKPLSDGSLAISFINVSEKDWKGRLSISVEQIEKAFGKKLVTANNFKVKDLWSGETWQNENGVFEISELGACDNVTILISGLPRPAGSQ
jgi:alpha-galactosidase